MRALTAYGGLLLLATAGSLAGCSGPHPAPTGPVSTANAGKAAFNEAKAIEKIYHAGYTGISSMRRDPDGVWRGDAIKKGGQTQVVVSVTEDGPVVAQ
jgi:putative membrane protein